MEKIIIEEMFGATRICPAKDVSFDETTSVYFVVNRKIHNGLKRFILDLQGHRALSGGILSIVSYILRQLQGTGELLIVNACQELSEMLGECGMEKYLYPDFNTSIYRSRYISAA